LCGNNTVILLSGWWVSKRQTNSCAPRQLTMRAVDQPERGVVFEAVPALAESHRMINVDDEVHGGEFVSVQPVAEAHGLDLGEADCVHEYQYLKSQMAFQDRAFGVRHFRHGSLGAKISR
jgi:hypothetical protein